MEEKPNLFKQAATFGAILGVVSIGVSLIIYIIDAALFASFWVAIILLVVSLGLIIYGGSQYRNEIGGYLSFGDAFKYSFVAFAVGGLIGIFFNILLFQVIDPGVKEIVIEESLANTEAMLERFGMSGDEFDQAMEDAEERTIEGFSTTGQLKNYGFALIFYAILSLITGAILKRKEPEAL